MGPATHEYDTELRYGAGAGDDEDKVVTLGAVVYRGRTVLRPGPDMYAPLRRWAQSVANHLRGPVTWRASAEGETVEEGTVLPEGND